MKQSIILWLIAFAITVGSAVYQRVTGPTYPHSGRVVLGGSDIAYRLDRSHGGDGDHRVQILAGKTNVEGILEWKRYNSGVDWTAVRMTNDNGMLTAELPWQPAAGKLMYRVSLRSGDSAVLIPSDEPVVIRFRGEVPWFILIPHIAAMFGAMLFSARTGLEYFKPEPKYRGLVFWTIGFLLVGGMILGPLVQKYAFDAYWSGWPLGGDLTDNKTAVALIGWLGAAIALRRSRRPARWIVLAAIILFVVYLIPHSLLGSELRYEEKHETGEERRP